MTVPIASLSSARGGVTTTSTNKKSGSSFLSNENAAQSQQTNLSIKVTEDTSETRKRIKYVLGDGDIINADKDKDNAINSLQLQRNN